MGEKVAEAVILTLSGESVMMGMLNTSMLAESPFLIVISCWDVWTENGRVRLWSTLPILFSDHSVNQTSLLLGALGLETSMSAAYITASTESCNAFAIPQTIVLSGSH